jgi:hypothetical protein
MGSPISTWEGAAAYFTFANQPAIIYELLAGAVIITALSIIMGGIHESEAYKKVNGKTRNDGPSSGKAALSGHLPSAGQALPCRAFGVESRDRSRQNVDAYLRRLSNTPARKAMARMPTGPTCCIARPTL